MKMIAFTVNPSERPIFERYYRDYGIELTMTAERPKPENAHLTQGADCINVLSDTAITPELWELYHQNGVRLGVTRCVGMEHMNADYANTLGIGVRNVTYSPASVADYAIMMMLMVLRHIKPMMLRSLVAAHLSGFGCKVLYWNRTPRDTIAAEYRPLDDLLKECDIISLHLTATDDTCHFMDAEKFAKMKPGSVLINTARGSLVDSDALIDALEQERLAGAGLDVLDEDRYIYYRDHKNTMLKHHQMAILQSMPNVLMLPHLAYFTDQALEDMVHNSLIVARDYFLEHP